MAVGGFGIHPVREAETIDFVLDALAAGRGGRIVTPNVDILRQAARGGECESVLRSADVVVADGMPLVWASRLAGRPLPERVAGSSFAPRLAIAALASGWRVLLLGGSEGVAESAAARLRAETGSTAIGWHFPPFGFESSESEQERIREAVSEHDPCVCLVGLGFPRQDRLGRELLDTFPRSWFVGAGATIGFIAGETSRAPLWAQRSGVEWVWRLAQEPRRLATRYLLRDVPYGSRLLAQAAKERFGVDRHAASA